MTTILIHTGTYMCKDYRLVKEYKNQKSALKFAKSIGYPFDEIFRTNWNFSGFKFTITHD